jgi:hypothetical protein
VRICLCISSSSTHTLANCCDAVVPVKLRCCYGAPARAIDAAVYIALNCERQQRAAGLGSDYYLPSVNVFCS